MNLKNYSHFHPENLRAFDLLMPLNEADEGVEEETQSFEPSAEENPTEDDIFKQAAEEADYPEDTNANIFLGKLETGEFSAVNADLSPNDPSIRGICAAITGDILTNPDSLEQYINILFEKTGVNDIKADTFRNVKGSIWKKFEMISAGDPQTSYGDFQKFIVNIVNGSRTSKGISDADAMNGEM